MPQRRTLLRNTAAFTVERVESLEPAAYWSRVYQVASRRFVLPHSGLSEFCWGDQLALLDGISVLCLPMGAPYQMQAILPMSPSGSDVNSKIVISLPADTAVAVAEPCISSLSARAQWQLRRCLRALERGAPAEPLLPVQQLLESGFRAPMACGPLPKRRRIHSVKRDIARRVASLDGPRWTLHDVADTAGLSLFHLAHLFKARTGMTLHAYRQQLRLVMALQCLQSGLRDLADLAAGLGYSSQSHMGFAFQRELGVTPAQARLALTG